MTNLKFIMVNNNKVAALKNLKKYHLVTLLVSAYILSACGESSITSNTADVSEKIKKVSYQKMDKKTTYNALNSLSNLPLSVTWKSGEKRIPDDVRLSDPSTTTSYKDGKMVKYDDIPLADYLAKNGSITIRKGEDFFPEWALEIDADNLTADSNIQFENDSTALQVTPAGKNIPDISYLKNTSGFIKTGKLSNLGMPIQFDIKIDDASDGRYNIQGKAFATIGDIRIKNGKLDATYDSFRTMDIVTRDYLKVKMNLTTLSSQHIEFSSAKNSKGVSEGVEGLLVYSHKTAQDEQALTRVHLLKQAEGWVANKILSPTELIYSRIKSSKRERDQMKVASYMKVEKFLEEKKLNNHIDTSISCSSTKSLGLCSVKITVLENNEKTCTRKAYSFKKGEKWKFNKEVTPDLKIDYKTTKLVKDKRKVKNLKEYILNESIGLMFGKCSMF